MSRTNENVPAVRQLLPSDPAETLKLFQRYAEDKDPRIRERIILLNERLVRNIARKIAQSPDEIDDFAAEGIIGLITAVEKFDLTRGNRFSTHATWWIMQRIRRYAQDKRRLIRLPVQTNREIHRIHRIESNLIQRLNRMPTLEELAEATGYTVEKLVEFMNQVEEPLSLDHVVSEDGKHTTLFADLISDETEIEEKYLANEDYQAIVRKFDVLTEREQFVLCNRYGLEGCRSHTLDEVGTMLKLTRERVRQIEAKAEKKLYMNTQQARARR